MYGQLTVQKFNGTNWTVVGAARFSAGQVSEVSLKIDALGTPYVAYGDGGNSGKATVMKFNGSGWVGVGTAGFSAGLALYPSLAINKEGMPYVAYQDQSNGINRKATVQRFSGGSWNVVGVAGFSAGNMSWPSLAINASGIPYVAYRDNSNNGNTTVQQFKPTVAVQSTTLGTGLSGIVVAPQPIHNSLTLINSDKALARTEAIITDIQGREVKRFVVEKNTQIDASQWPVGVYLMRLADGSSLRVVKE